MNQPINYLAMLPQVDVGGQFAQGMAQGLQANQLMQQQQALEQQQQEAINKQRLAEKYAQDAEFLKGNFSKKNLMSFILAYPTHSDKYKPVIESLDNDIKQNEMVLSTRALNSIASGDIDGAKSVFDEIITATDNSGRSTSALKSMREKLDTNPNAVAFELGSYRNALNPDQVKKELDAENARAEEARKAELHPSTLAEAKVKAKGRSLYAQQLIDAGGIEGSPEFNRKMNAYNEAVIEGKAKGEGTIINMPSQVKAVGNIADMVNDLNRTVEPYTKIINLGDMARASILSAIKDSNSSSWLSAKRAFISMTDQGNISDKDMKTAGVSPEVISGVADRFNEWVTSVPSPQFMRKMADATKILQDVSRNKMRESIGAQKELARLSGNTQDVIDNAFASHDANINRGVKKQPTNNPAQAIAPARQAPQEVITKPTRPAPAGVPVELWANMTDLERAKWK